MTVMKWLRLFGLFLLVLIAGPAIMAASGDVQFGRAWFETDRSSAGLAPDPARTPEAVVQVYAARAFNWRGIFAVHTWIATKRRNADNYTVYQVMAWHQAPLASITDSPDRRWFDSTPEVLTELRGATATDAIAYIETAAATYPFANAYRIWPGPNSNTFTAWVVRQVPQLDVALPSTAIGKDYLTDGPLARAPSDTGYQVSLYGVLGVLVARREGLEINLLGLVFGVDPTGPAIKLPGVGRVGFDPAP